MNEEKWIFRGLGGLGVLFFMGLFWQMQAQTYWTYDVICTKNGVITQEIRGASTAYYAQRAAYIHTSKGSYFPDGGDACRIFVDKHGHIGPRRLLGEK